MFLSRLVELVKPYRFRLFAGVLLGVLAGLVEPLLMVCAKLVIDALFPTANGVSVLALPTWAPAVA